jgi:hypothetical protein
LDQTTLWSFFVGIAAIAKSRIRRGLIAARVWLCATPKAPAKTPPKAPPKTLTRQALPDPTRPRPNYDATAGLPLHPLERRSCESFGERP